MSADRDRDAEGRARNARLRDRLGRPLDERGTAPAPDPAALTPEAALTRAQALLDDDEPFAAHEVLEASWKVAPADERALWRGLAQLAVGITHARRGNPTGARALLRRASESLASYDAASPHGVDVSGVRQWAEAAAADLGGASGPPTLRR